jgi:hypothetical protein
MIALCRREPIPIGLSGVQFALPEAVELLEKVSRTHPSGEGAPIVLSSLDPVLPFGGGLDWGLQDPRGNPLKLVRSASNHLAPHLLETGFEKEGAHLVLWPSGV